MENVHVTVNGKLLSSVKGEPLSDVFSKAGVNFPMPCAQTGKCGKCRVTVSGKASSVSDTEKKLLTEDELNHGTRLLCQTFVDKESLIVTVSTKEILLQNINIGSETFTVENPLFDKLGVAVDIGTTTIVAKLFDSKGFLAVSYRKNTQCIFGADVISRIRLAISGNLSELQSSIVCDLNTMISELINATEYDIQNVDTIVITGNTTMLYLLVGKNPATLACAPFNADDLFGKWVESDLSLSAGNPRIYLCNCMSAFVGADITTAILATNMLKKNNSMLLDIGTNGEIALWEGDKLSCCATAAGPAFEGAELYSGMPAQNGAIERVFLQDGLIHTKVIGDVKAKGICGSGILDAVYVLLCLGAIDDTGHMEETVLNEFGSLCKINNQPAFKLANNVYVTQEDIRKIQLAKSAICSGIDTLLNQCKKDIDLLYLAGGFGSHLHLDSAAGIGLIPSRLKNKTVPVGNAALDGACKILCDKSSLEILQNIPNMAQIIDLAENSFFMTRYVENMMFNI